MTLAETPGINSHVPKVGPLLPDGPLRLRPHPVLAAGPPQVLAAGHHLALFNSVFTRAIAAAPRAPGVAVGVFVLLGRFVLR